MILELDIPKTFTRTIQLESPSEAYEAILAHELKKNPRKDNLNFNSAYLRNGSNNRVVYYLETENNETKLGAILIADVKHATEEKENIIYYVVSYKKEEEAKRIVEPFSMKFFKTLSSACVYTSGLIAGENMPEKSIKDLSLDQHVEAIRNSFTNYNIKVAFNSEINYQLSQLPASMSAEEKLIAAVNEAIKKEHFYLTPYIQAVNKAAQGKLESSLKSFLI